MAAIPAASQKMTSERSAGNDCSNNAEEIFSKGVLSDTENAPLQKISP
jgi:hypothetical protein